MFESLRKLKNYISPYIWDDKSNRNHVVGSLALDFINSFIKLAAPLMLSNAIDENDDFEDVVTNPRVLVISGVGLAAAIALPSARDYLLAAARARTQGQLSEDLLRSTYHLPLDE